jgi:LacI family transcriptional regulator
MAASRIMKNAPDKMDMEQIARRLGVSKTTVHYAIRNTGRLSEKTRKRVLKVVQDVGYRPNGLARSFRRRRADTVGVVLVTLANSVHSHLLEGVESIARQNRHTMLVACSHGNCDAEREMVEVFMEQGIEGLIIVPCDPKQNEEFYRGLQKRGVRLVFVDREVRGLDVEMVATDHEKGGYLEAKHLIELGRRKIVCIATRSPRRRSTSVQDRIHGVNRALREAGLESAVVVGTDTPDISVHEQYGYTVMTEHLKHAAGRFDAVFAVHDDLAYGAIRALTEFGMRVPKDVAVVGFDDQDPSAYIQPPLTTIRQPMREIGMEAARLLFARFNTTEPQAQPQRIILAPTLVVRQSSGSAV